MTGWLFAQTSQPSEKDEQLAYWKELFKLSDTDQYQKGRERAERGYLKGKAELEAYGMRPVRPGDDRFVDTQTGLYERPMGCCIVFGEEVKGYNERLRELVKQRGLPADARHLREQMKVLDTFREKAPDVTWQPLPAAAANPGPMIHDGPISARLETREYRGLHSEVQTYQVLNIRRGEKELMLLRPEENSLPCEIAYWKQAEALIVKYQRPHPHFCFVDCKYGRQLWDFDPILLQQFQAPGQRPQATQPAIF
jgi:hypothetical protein